MNKLTSTLTHSFKKSGMIVLLTLICQSAIADSIPVNGSSSIQVGGYGCHNPYSPSDVCVSGVTSLDSGNYSAYNGIFLSGGGNITADTMTAYSTSSKSPSQPGAIRTYTGVVMQDTYTLQGAAGLVDIEAIFGATGLLHILDTRINGVGGLSGTAYASVLLGPSITVPNGGLNGIFDQDTAYAGSRNTVVDTYFNLQAMQIKTVEVGVPFTLGYHLALETYSSQVTASSYIDFIIPDGYTLTSEAGWNASAAVVPVPAAAWLFGSGLIGLIGIARRKKASLV